MPTTEKEKAAPYPRFGRWLDEQLEKEGAEALAERFEVDKTTVWAWRRYALGLKAPRTPRPIVAKKLVAYANGSLQLRDIY